jgi:hypothetical protein
VAIHGSVYEVSGSGRRRSIKNFLVAMVIALLRVVVVVVHC